jgi:fructokinase
MIACYGEALVDLFVSPYSQKSLSTDSKACLGGSVFNFCLAAQRQGLRSAYLNALSVDGFGRQFDRILQGEGVIIDAKPCPEPTSVAVIELDAQGNASYAFHRNAVADTARTAIEIIANWHASALVLHTGCLMLAPNHWPQTESIIAHAAKSGCVVSVDANLRPAVMAQSADYLACVRQACAAAHIVKVSDDDLITLGMLPLAERGNLQAARLAAQSLLGTGHATCLVALTCGAQGAFLLTQEHCVFQAAPGGMAVKDTVGAGDSFAAALIAHLNWREQLVVANLQQGLVLSELQDALEHAVAAASLCVQRVGCDPATWTETRSCVQQAA